ncbi:MAG TPA: hypothetical protein VGS80_02135 [Ktedonobacterales bacterium]|nr:hypothetical protein [Ktedonobacterales bacterium]
MTCPTCGLNLGSTPPETCPRCGAPLRADAAANPSAQTPGMAGMGQSPMANPFGQPPTPGYGPPQGSNPSGQPPNPYGLAQPPDPYGQPPTPMPNSGQEQPSTPFGPPTPNYGQPPAPTYGQPQAPNPYGQDITQSYTPPFAGQPAQQPAPPYGQAAPPSPWPVAGGGKPGGSPFTPARPRRAGGAIARVVGAVIVLAVIVVGALVYNAVKGDTVYSSALTGTVRDWPNTGGCSPESDGYHITAGVACYPDLADQNDVTLTVAVKQLSGDQGQPYGVSFRRVSQGNRYFFDIDSNGEWGFGKSVSSTDSFIVDATTNAAIHTGLNASNTLQVQAKGSHFTFFVNGTQVGQGDDATYVSGKWGLEGANNIEVMFNNITITNTK